MTPLKTAFKSIFEAFGLKLSRIDPLAARIPPQYESSPFLPRVYKDSVKRLFYFRDMLQMVRSVEGSIVECGVSIGHGLLYFSLLSELLETPRHIFGFDSFDGFPEPTAEDKSGRGVKRGELASPISMVSKVLQDGRVSASYMDSNVHLVRGFFDKTLPGFEGTIALLHLDCDLYNSYKVCLEHLYGKVAKGGLILFDEYLHPDWVGATKAVDEFFASRPEKPRRHECGKYYLVKA